MTRRIPALFVFIAAGFLRTHACRAQDDHPDTCDGATPLQLGVPVETAIETPGDVDFLVFQARAGHHSIIQTFAGSLGWWPEVTLFGADCAAVLAPSYDADGVRDIYPTADMPVYVRVRTVAGSFLPTGAGRISVIDTGPAADDHANTPPNATLLPVDGAPVEGRYDYWLDSDYFLIPALHGGTYRILLSTPSAESVGFELDLIASDAATVLSHSWDWINSSESGVHYLYVPATTPLPRAARYLKVYDRSPVSGAPQYRLSLTEVHRSTHDDHPGSCDAAVSYPLNVWIDDAIETPGDLDVLAFDVERDHRYLLQTDRATDGFQVSGAMLDQDCRPFDESATFGEYNGLFRAPATGRAFLRLSAVPSNPATGSCLLRLLDAGTFEDDHPDSAHDALVITADGTIAAGTINDPHDRDVVGVDLVERTTYALETRGRPSASVLAGMGVRRGNSSWTANPAEWTRSYVYIPAGGGGRHSIVMSGSESNADWRVRISPARSYAPVPDPGADCPGDALIPLDTWVPVMLDTSDDVDVVRFPTLINHIYEVEFAYQSNEPITSLRHVCRDSITCNACESFTVRAPDSDGISLRSAAWPGTGAFEVRVTDTGEMADDHADGPSGATPVFPDAQVLTGVAGGAFQEYDTFALHLDTPGRYAVRLSVTGGGNPAVGSLLDRDGQTHFDGLYDPSVSALSDYEEREIIIPPGRTGTYFLEVRGDRYFVPTSYEVQLRHACAGDFNRDGVADSRDFFDYLTSFFAGGGAADFNNDGAVTSADFFAFLDAFRAGCP
jgi:hypothetical protein